MTKENVPDTVGERAPGLILTIECRIRRQRLEEAQILSQIHVLPVQSAVQLQADALDADHILVHVHSLTLDRLYLGLRAAFHVQGIRNPHHWSFEPQQRC